MIDSSTIAHFQGTMMSDCGCDGQGSELTKAPADLQQVAEATMRSGRVLDDGEFHFDPDLFPSAEDRFDLGPMFDPEDVQILPPTFDNCIQLLMNMARLGGDIAEQAMALRDCDTPGHGGCAGMQFALNTMVSELLSLQLEYLARCNGLKPGPF